MRLRCRLYGLANVPRLGTHERTSWEIFHMMLHKAKFGIGIAAVGMASLIIPAAPAFAGEHAAAIVPHGLPPARDRPPTARCASWEQAGDRPGQTSEAGDSRGDGAPERQLGHRPKGSHGHLHLWPEGREQAHLRSLQGLPRRRCSPLSRLHSRSCPAEENAVKHSTSVAQFEKAESKAVSNPSFTNAGKVVATPTSPACAGQLTAPTPTS